MLRCECRAYIFSFEWDISYPALLRHTRYNLLHNTNQTVVPGESDFVTALSALHGAHIFARKLPGPTAAAAICRQLSGHDVQVAVTGYRIVERYGCSRGRACVVLR